MKKIFILISLIISSATSFSQRKDSSSRFTEAHYLQKSKNQKTGAWLLTSAALAVGLGAMAHDVNNMFNEEPASKAWPYAGVMLASGITLFITSAVNRKKANRVSLSMNIENVPTLRYAVVSNRPLPSLGISVHF